MSNPQIDKMNDGRKIFVYAFLEYYKNYTGIKKLLLYKYILIFEIVFDAITTNYNVRENIKGIRDICDSMEKLADDFESNPRKYD